MRNSIGCTWEKNTREYVHTKTREKAGHLFLSKSVIFYTYIPYLLIELLVRIHDIWRAQYMVPLIPCLLGDFMPETHCICICIMHKHNI